MRTKTPNLIKLTIGLGTLIIGAQSMALTITPDFNILSAMKNTANLSTSFTSYDTKVTLDGTEGTVYINSTNVIGGAGWNSNINMSGAFDSVLGTALSGAQTFNLSTANRSGAVDSSVANGIYNFSVDVLGGTTATSTNILATLNLQLEVFQGLSFNVSSVSTPGTIGPGQTSTVGATLTNTMANRNLHTTTWYTSTGNFELNGEILNGTFVGDWFNKDIVPGSSYTSDHTQYTASATQMPGVYAGNVGFFAGLYEGDDHWIRINPDPTITVVPEPMTIAVLGLGISGLMRRNRKQLG
jgi:hypothetical protein